MLQDISLSALLSLWVVQMNLSLARGMQRVINQYGSAHLYSLSRYEAGWGPRRAVTATAAKSCEVAKSCKVAKSCEVAGDDVWGTPLVFVHVCAEPR